ncbi:MAG: orotidine-5'-phosphate decarboxylase [Armatimonadetes bacterium]|nr:orotidine-5'-phosphate decarboxylase [Armatimonadota bacterium]
MAGNFADRLAEAIRQKDSRVCVGLDPRLDLLPELPATSATSRVEAFCCAICTAVAPYTVAVKPQSAYFEALAPDGLACMWRVIRFARELGLLVIVDAKRNDIGSTAEAYVQACLGLHAGSAEPLADAVTVNAYLGADGVRPFVEAAATYGTGAFVLVKTSNPSSGDLQDLRLDSGLTVYQHMADLVAQWGRGLVGQSGYSSVGAVVGATYPEQLRELRQRVPTVPFLVPGYGHQGATADDVAGGFDVAGLGAIVNSSRGIIYAYRERELDPGEAAAQAAEEMRLALNAALLH